jgi:Domain of unknown function (DUF4190)
VTTTAETKQCPLCGESIMAVAKKCRYCGEYFDAADRPRPERPGSLDSMMLPVGRPASAIAAGYLGLLSFFPLIGIPLGIGGVITGIVALKRIGREPELRGRGRAWFGIVAGGLMAVLWTFMAVAMVAESARRHGR